MKVLVLFIAMVCAIACTTTETILDFNLVEGSINKLDSAYCYFPGTGLPFSIGCPRERNVENEYQGRRFCYISVWQVVH